MELIYRIIIILSPAIPLWDNDLVDLIKWKIPDKYKNEMYF